MLSNQQKRPADPGREPEQTADPDAEEAENTPGTVMESHFELKWARRPANELRRLIGKEDMGNETHRQADDADTQYKRVEQEDVDDTLRGSRNIAERHV